MENHWLEQAQTFREVFQKLPHDCQYEVMKQRDGLLAQEAFVIVVRLNDGITHTLYLQRVGTEYEEVITWEKNLASKPPSCYKFHLSQKDTIVEDVIDDIIDKSNDLVADVFHIKAGRRSDPLFSYEFKASDYYDYIGDDNAHKVYKKLAGDLHVTLCRMLGYAERHKI